MGLTLLLRDTADRTLKRATKVVPADIENQVEAEPAFQSYRDRQYRTGAERSVRSDVPQHVPVQASDVAQRVQRALGH
jgi:uncharacterized protein with gpF-like domain